jgi:uncharacterized membrane protein
MIKKIAISILLTTSIGVAAQTPLDDYENYPTVNEQVMNSQPTGQKISRDVYDLSASKTMVFGTNSDVYDMSNSVPNKLTN